MDAHARRENVGLFSEHRAMFPVFKSLLHVFSQNI